MFRYIHTEWDRKILRVILGLSKSRAEIDKLEMDSDSIAQNRYNVLNFFEELKIQEVMRNKLCLRT